MNSPQLAPASPQGLASSGRESPALSYKVDEDVSPLELDKGGSLAPWCTGAGVGKCYFIANIAKGLIKSPEIM